jgi:hypothetical protein
MVSAVMFQFIRRLFARANQRDSPGSDAPAGSQIRSALIVAHPCSTSVKLVSPITTPFGSKITVAKPIVDIRFSVGVDGEIQVQSVRLTKSSQLGSRAINATSASGESFRLSRRLPSGVLIRAVQAELRR